MDELTRQQLVVAFQTLQAIAAGPRSYLTVIGGMVPTLRTRDCDRAPQHEHAGTTDLDLSVRMVLAAGTTAAYYRSLTEALRNHLNLRPHGELVAHAPMWRWVDDPQGRGRKVELLVEVPAGAAPADTVTMHNAGERDGDHELFLLAMPHVELAHRDRRTVQLDLQIDNRVRPDAEFPVAGLGSWLVLKRWTADKRGEAPAAGNGPLGKDYYDVAWLLLCLGVEPVGRELAASPLLEREAEREVLIEALTWLRNQYERPELSGPSLYHDDALRAGADLDETAKRDASAGVVGAIDASGVLRIGG